MTLGNEIRTTQANNSNPKKDLIHFPLISSESGKHLISLTEIKQLK